jgi:hypothetical protein
MGRNPADEQPALRSRPAPRPRQAPDAALRSAGRVPRRARRRDQVLRAKDKAAAARCVLVLPSHSRPVIQAAARFWFHEDGAISRVRNDGSNGSALGLRAFGAAVARSEPRGRRSGSGGRRRRCPSRRRWCVDRGWASVRCPALLGLVLSSTLVERGWRPFGAVNSPRLGSRGESMWLG